MTIDFVFWVLFVITVFFWAVLPIWRGGTLWVPTYQRIVKRMLQLANVKPGDLVFDLGSGDGRIPIAAAREFGAKAVGVEINFFLIWWSRLRARLLGAKKVRFIWKDLWSVDVREADVITIFLFDWSTSKLGEKLLRECKPSVRIVSYLWKLGRGWKLVASDPAQHIWVYQKEKT